MNRPEPKSQQISRRPSAETTSGSQPKLLLLSEHVPAQARGKWTGKRVRHAQPAGPPRMTRDPPLTTGPSYESRADHFCAKAQVVPAGYTR
jgi:hypothetical protein